MRFPVVCGLYTPVRPRQVRRIMHHEYVERVVDLLDPAANQIYNMSVEEARARVLNGKPEAVAELGRHLHS